LFVARSSQLSSMPFNLVMPSWLAKAEATKKPERAAGEDLEEEIEVDTDWAHLLNATPPEADSKRWGSHEVFLFNVFSRDECERLIKASEEHGFGATTYQKSYRGNLRLIAFDEHLAELMWSRMKDLVPQEVDMPNDDRKWDAYGLNTCFRLSKYHPGDRFQEHCDAAFTKERGQDMSMFTVNIYLNDVKDGGATRFYFRRARKADQEIPPEAGLCLLFRQPPGQHYFHDGEQLASGLKYLLRTDVMYRRRSTAEPVATIKDQSPST